MQAWAAINAPGVDCEHETKAFRLHEWKKPVSDWSKAWQRWMLRAKTYADQRRAGSGGARAATGRRDFSKLDYSAGVVDGHLV
jgi:hypothetical protein